jgi:predicted lysophospholipase L1 biosynthesis ABC-type transport system permease subunit
VLDATDPVVERLAADPDVDAVARLRYSQIEVAGEPTEVYAFAPVRGTVSWTMLSGRSPADAAPEVALGPRLAARLDRRIGDEVVIGGQSLRVVGIGLGPTRQNERLGDSLLVAPTTLATLVEGPATLDAMVRTAPGTVDAVRARFVGAELDAPSQPDDVEHVVALGRLPETVGAVLGLLFLAVLAHALASTARRRAADVAVLRAVGFTSRQVAGSVLAPAAVVVAVGVVGGIPLGLATGRLLWWALAHDSGVATDLARPWTAVAAVAAATLAAGLVVAARPARRATRLDLGALLRTE